MKKIAFLMTLFVINFLFADQLDQYEKIQNLESTLEQRISNELSVKMNKEPFTVFVKVITKDVIDSPKDENVDLNFVDEPIFLPGLFESTNDAKNKFSENSSRSTWIDHIEVFLTLDYKIDSFSSRLAEDIIHRKAELVENRGDRVIIKKADLSDKKLEMKDKTELIKDVQKALESYESELQKMRQNHTEEMQKLKNSLAGEFRSAENKLDRRLDTFKEKYREDLNTVYGKTQTTDSSQNRQISYIDKKFEDKLAEIDKKYDEKLDKFLENAQVTIANSQQKYENKLESIDASLSNEQKVIYYWLLFLAIAFILSAYLVYLFISNSNKKIKENVQDSFNNVFSSVKNMKEELDKTKKEFSAIDSKANDKFSTSKDLAGLFVARKNGVKHFILDSLNSQEGRNKIGLLASQVGMRNIESLFSEKETSQIDEVRNIVNIYKMPSSEFLASEIENLRQEVISKTDSMYQGKTKFNPFEFVKGMNDQQIMLLLDNEDIGTQAFILSQIEDIQSARILENLSVDDRIAVTLELATMNPPSGQAYISLSERLSNKLTSMPSINKYVVDGSKELMNKILMMSPDEQESILNKLKTQNIQLWTQLRQNYYIFNDLINLNDETLKATIYAMPMKDLAIALKGSSDELINKVMNMLNERLRFSFEEEIKLLSISSNSVTEDKVREMKAKLIKNATKIAQERGEL